MGGTWVTHWMGYLQKEMERYGMANDLILTKTPDGGADYFTLDTGEQRHGNMVNTSVADTPQVGDHVV